jgi:hypothetical protein
MTATSSTAQRPPGRLGAGRTLALVAGALAGLLAFAFLVAGGLLLWGDAQKDADGYLSTATEQYRSPAHAVVTDDLDLDLADAGWVLGSDKLGALRLQATSRDGKPVFVGVAPSRDVSAYLAHSAYSRLTDVSFDPFDADYRLHGGDRAPATPAAQDFWAASARGIGTQTVDWKIRDGRWSVVVMNADGSRGVDVGVKAGADVPLLTGVAWAVTAGGLALLALAVALVVIGLRPPRPPHPAPAPVGLAAPAAA